jgi:OOP family OmpA-OmpF porin
VPPQQPRKVVFSADALFDFDKAVLKPAGVIALDAFANEVRPTNYSVITVTGHTDRIGSRPYNLKLSTRRAEAVKSHLAGPGRLPADRIAASGKNGDQPVTKPADCPGKGVSKKLIACLQPDRRVEVEVTATRTP